MSGYKYSIVRLNDTNYIEWEHQIALILSGEGLWEYVSGEKRMPNADAALEEMKAWKRKDHQAMAHITCTVESVAKPTIFDARSSAEMWNKLKTKYEGRNKASLHSLRLELTSMKLRAKESIHSFADRITMIGTSMAKAGRELHDDEKATALLAGLPDGYNAVKDSYITHKTLPEFIELVARLEEKERQMKIDSEASDDENTDKRGGTSFFTKRQPRKRMNRSVECYQCGKKGHIRRDCWSNPKNRNRNERRDQASREANVTRIGLVAGDKSSSLNENTWFLDTCASDHMTGYKEILEDYQPLEDTEPVATADKGTSIEAVGKGNVRLMSEVDGEKFKILLTGVSYVPDIRQNLISSGRLSAKGSSISHPAYTGEVIVRNKASDLHRESRP
ncbi:gag-polypeptide of LTR copia-type [Gracilaria domingensis]|nr:gag-polypeptide of LTR copia-type [Gracilaria domingensis]